MDSKAKIDLSGAISSSLEDFSNSILTKINNSTLEDLLNSMAPFLKSFCNSFGIYSVSLEFVTDEHNFFSFFKPEDKTTWKDKSLERIAVYSEIGQTKYDDSIIFKNRPIEHLIERAITIPTLFKFILEGKPFQVYYNKKYLAKLIDAGYLSPNFYERNKRVYDEELREDKSFKIRYPTIGDFIRRLTLPLYLKEPSKTDNSRDLKIYGLINMDRFSLDLKNDEPVPERYITDLQQFLRRFTKFWDASLFDPAAGLNQQLERVSKSIIKFEQELAEKEKPANTLLHSHNVYTLVSDFLRYLCSKGEEKFSALEYFSIRYGALVHDAGKTLIPVEILTKPDKLTKEEFEIIKKHPLLGFEMLKNSNIPSQSLEIVLYHHERENGSGYPMGLVGNTIPKGARIVAIVDVFEALLGRRPYRRPIDNVKDGKFRVNKSLEIIKTMGEKNKLYLPYVNAFINYIHSLGIEAKQIEGPIDKNHEAAVYFYKTITEDDKQHYF